MYEARWHEVAKFVRKLTPLLRPLRSVWDSRKFEAAGVDVEGGALPHAPAGASAFDPQALTCCLQCPKFASYVCLVNKLEQVPERLASWAEDCYCHERVCEHLSQHKRHEVLKPHYETICVCPMAGKRAPELAAGHIQNVFRDICEKSLTELLFDSPLPLGPENQQHIVSELQRAQNHVQLLLSTKLQHWQRMPWLACGLAHHDEATARRVAQQILACFEECSDAELHHRVTQQFLTAPLYPELQRFAEGTAFEETSLAFQTAVIRLHFIPVVETTVEAKHAVSTRLHKRDTHTGPVMVSLHNRMTILEHRLENEPGFLGRLATQVTTARRLGALPLKLGLHRHPLIVDVENIRGRHAVSAYLQKPLTAVIYRTDLESQYKPLNQARKQNESSRKHHQDVMQKALRDHNVGSRTLALRDQARHGLILDHFRAVAKSSDGQAMVFSLPSSSEASIQRLSDFFARPEIKQTSQNAGVLEDCAEDLDAAGSVPGSSPVFFTVTKTKPSANHHLYVRPGAGASLKSRHVAVALRSSVPLSAGPTQYSVTCQDVRDNGCSDNLALLSTCAGQYASFLPCWRALTHRCPGRRSS